MLIVFEIYASTPEVVISLMREKQINPYMHQLLLVYTSQ